MLFGYPVGAAIPVLRYIVLVGWAIIALWSLPSARLALVKAAEPTDYKRVALGIVGIALVIGQLNALTGGIPSLHDYWTAVTLLLLSVAAAVVILLVHVRRTPPEHQRALIIADFIILALCVAGGTIG